MADLSSFFAKKKKGKVKAVNLNVAPPGEKKEEEKKEVKTEEDKNWTDDREVERTPQAVPTNMVTTLKTEKEEEKASKQWGSAPKAVPQKFGSYVASYQAPGAVTGHRFPTLGTGIQDSTVRLGAAKNEKASMKNNAFAGLNNDEDDSDDDGNTKGAVVKAAFVSKQKGQSVAKHMDNAIKATGIKEDKKGEELDEKALAELEKKKAEKERKKAESERKKAEIKASLSAKKTDEKVNSTFDQSKFKYGVFSSEACASKYMESGKFEKREIPAKFQAMVQ